MLKWFSIDGIKKEVERIRWPNTKELLSTSLEVLIFCILFGVFFVTSEAVIVFLLKLIGIGV